ncbi:DUF7373 family lipoprotein [Nocardia arthritidis]|uniref:Uncharacterized protein n=1 Tax=Nocardia arthritidis TaxID=228602 RepID=A0A6G9YBH8_9NOCA|nr:hypothetical protein [Nocardia arthritidis]QIS10383.1 hypothetical protein F5544_12460 [Nocardia arthritidis]
MGYLLVIVVALMLAAGCVRDGIPVPAGPDGVLDVGPYATEPTVAPRDSNEKYGRVVESVRMGEAVIDPVEADPALSHGLGSHGSLVLPTPARTQGLLSDPVRAVLERRGMLAGYAVGGADRDTGANPVVGTARLLTVVLLRFPDPAAAAQAAQEIDAADASVSPANVAVSIPGISAAHSHWRPNIPTLAATMAQDSFVISLLVGHTTPDQALLTGLAAKAFGAQATRLREFRPTPRDGIATLPLDQDGMLARTLPEKPGRWQFPLVISADRDRNAGWSGTTVVRGVVYGPRATHLFVGRSGGAEAELFAAGTYSNVSRFADVAVARKAFGEAAKDALADPDVRAAPPVAGLPDSNCFQFLGGNEDQIAFACQVLYGRYESVIYGGTLKDTQQRAAAQYALLANSESR